MQAFRAAQRTSPGKSSNIQIRMIFKGIYRKLDYRMKRSSNLVNQFRTRFFVPQPLESIYFFTLHKCASTLFSSFVLKNLEGLTHVDYAKDLTSGRRSPRKALPFHDYGIIYGPIRLSNDPENLISRHLIKPIYSPDFLTDKRAVFFVRDPRDILVSAYYSFGYTPLVSDTFRPQTA